MIASDAPVFHFHPLGDENAELRELCVTGLAVCHKIKVKMAMRNCAIVKCTNLIHHTKSVRTVKPPSNPATITNDKAVEHKIIVFRLCLSFIKAITISANTSNPSKVPVILCEYSIRVWKSKGGISLPWQSGQSGHPRPDPDVRTKPPKEIWIKAITRLAEAKNLKLILCQERKRNDRLKGIAEPQHSLDTMCFISLMNTTIAFSYGQKIVRE